MGRLVRFAVALLASGLFAVWLQAPPAHAAVPAAKRSLLVGELGYEGGPYPGQLHPTAGSVEVEFSNVPLVLEKKVGRSGQFKIPLGPGTYTVIGCGPTRSGGTSSSTCSKPQQVTLSAGEVVFVELVWAYAP